MYLIVKRKNIFIAIVALLSLTSCHSHYNLTNVERSRVLIDSRYDLLPLDEDVETFISPYKEKVDSIMSPVVGRAAKYMAAERPESPLSNLLADILVWSGKDYNEQPIFGVYNMGGMRAAFAPGDITVGDVLEVAPFENKICFVTLSGDKVLELFNQIALIGGEAISHGVELVIDKDKNLLSAKINGEEIDPQKDYRIATIDYVAQGNDMMEAFKASQDINSPQSEDNNIRYVIEKYIREKASEDQMIDATVEGRIKILEE
ncbi:MAG: 5'-nucleotidase C-terminal domain-containing protein [Prevotella sp.]|nr:5'-nucleotidase C-terminal domain-containing protein [Prevotella sp.]